MHTGHLDDWAVFFILCVLSDELNVSKTEVQKKDEETITLKDQLSDAQKRTEDQSKMVVDLQGE